MGYPIIFQNYFIRKDDKIINLARFGCNNDDQGRRRNVLNLMDVYNLQDFVGKQWEIRQTAEDTEGWDLKVYNKYLNFKEYALYTLRCIGRSKTFDDFSKMYNMQSLTYERHGDTLRPILRFIMSFEQLEEICKENKENYGKYEILIHKRQYRRY